MAAWEGQTRTQALSAALQTNVGKSVRAEDLGAFDDFFVETTDLSALEGNTNQLVFGRRGSGKTLLFGTLNERIRAQFPHQPVVSFYYTATDFRSSPDYGAGTPTIKEKTHAFFHSFVERLALDVFDLADEVLFKKPGWLDTLRLGGDSNRFKRERLTRLVLDLLEASGYGAETPFPRSRETRTTETDARNQSQHTGASLSLSAEAPLLHGTTPLRASFAGNHTADRRREHTTTTTEETSRHFRPYLVRSLLIQIIELLELDYLVIFLDEWMSLAECQIDFAERLKQCLFGDKRIAVKIAADQYQCEFNNSGQGHNFRGLDIGADIFDEVDLDRPFQDPEHRTILFLEALYRRLHFFAPQLDHFFGVAPLSNPDFFRTSLFATDQAFAELCAGSHGLCRDFHRLFQLCVKRFGADISSQKLDFETVRRAIIQFTDDVYARAKKSVDSNVLLFNIINPHIERTHSRYFILDSEAGHASAVVNDLLSKRVIHSIPNAALHPSVRGEYDCFEISYGIFIDLMRAAEFSTGVKIDDTYDASEIAKITSANKEAFLLDLSSLQPTSSTAADLLLCSECQREFYSNEKAYVVRKMCPYCFADQDASRL